MRTLLSFGALLVLSATAHAQVTLQNDSFVSGGAVNFQAGFAPNEIAASRFDAPDAGRQLLRVHFLFGPSSIARDITLKVWDDSAGTVNPGAELHSADFSVTGAADAFQEIELTADNIVVPQRFRVGIVFSVLGDPQIASDLGGITANRNFIFLDSGTWGEAGGLGVTGDFVLRVDVSGGGGGSPDAAPGSPDAATGGGDCNGNSECSVGEYCDVANHVCTFDCREDTDCTGDNTCSSLGQCVTGGGGGGCQTDGGPAGGGALVLCGLGVIALGARRRRRSAPTSSG